MLVENRTGNEGRRGEIAGFIGGKVNENGLVICLYFNGTAVDFGQTGGLQRPCQKIGREVVFLENAVNEVAFRIEQEDVLVVHFVLQSVERRVI